MTETVTDYLVHISTFLPGKWPTNPESVFLQRSICRRYVSVCTSAIIGLFYLHSGNRVCVRKLRRSVSSFFSPSVTRVPKMLLCHGRHVDKCKRLVSSIFITSCVMHWRTSKIESIIVTLMGRIC
jgi:hypothetical protein